MTENAENPVKTDASTPDASTTNSTTPDASTKNTAEGATSGTEKKENIFERAAADIKNEAEKVKDKFSKHKDNPKS